MSLAPHSLELLNRLSAVINTASESDIRYNVGLEEHSPWRDDTLGLAHEGDYRAFFAPFDWINDAADIVIVGVTPGKQQATEAMLTFHRELNRGRDIIEASRIAKSAASFKGGMRALGARLMDHFNFHKLFGMSSTSELFGDAAGRAHYTSALRYPVLKRYSNYSGDSRIISRPFMRHMIENYLAEELAALPTAWIVPFGTNASRALDYLISQGRITSDRVLSGILHPGGQQWNRYNIQLGLVSGAVALAVPGGADVQRKSEALRAKVEGLLMVS